MTKNSGSFKPGNPTRFTSENQPRFRLPQNLLNVDRITAKEVNLVICKYLRTTVEDLSILMKDQEKSSKLTALEAVIINVIWKCAAEGDVYKLDSLLNRLVGRIKETLPENEHDEELKKKLAELPEESVIKYLRSVKDA